MTNEKVNEYLENEKNIILLDDSNKDKKKYNIKEWKSIYDERFDKFNQKKNENIDFNRKIKNELKKTKKKKP